MPIKKKVNDTGKAKSKKKGSQKFFLQWERMKTRVHFPLPGKRAG
jgi:hypothetical protein